MTVPKLTEMCVKEWQCAGKGGHTKSSSISIRLILPSHTSHVMCVQMKPSKLTTRSPNNSRHLERDIQDCIIR